MKQAEIWNVDLNLVKGSEQAGLRPVVILSGNLANEYLRTLIVCPLTTKIKAYKGNPILNPDLKNGLKRNQRCWFFIFVPSQKTDLSINWGKFRQNAWNK